MKYLQYIIFFIYIMDFISNCYKIIEPHENKFYFYTRGPNKDFQNIRSCTESKSKLRSIELKNFERVKKEEVEKYQENLSIFNIIYNYFYPQKKKVTRGYHNIPHTLYYIDDNMLKPFPDNDYIEAEVPYNWIPVFENKNIVWYTRKLRDINDTVYNLNI